MTMSMQVIKRKGSNYYKPSKKHAVAADRTPGKRNPGAISLSRPEEYTMHHRERGQIELPSGYTIAETWAGIRKSWMGFRAAKTDGNRDMMRKYAQNIRKMQSDMGISETIFDDDLLSQQVIDGIEMEMRILNASYDATRKAKVEEFNRELELEERVPDYDAIMHDVKNEPQAPLPREEIFVTYKESANACPVPIEPACAVEVMHDSPRKREKACPYVYVPTSEAIMHDYKKEQKRKREKSRQLKSCFIKIKA